MGNVEVNLTIDDLKMLTGRSRSVIVRAIARLHENGTVFRIKDKGRGRGGKVYSYVIHPNRRDYLESHGYFSIAPDFRTKLKRYGYI